MMKADEYQQLASRTMNPTVKGRVPELSNWGLGIGGEAGEIEELVKKELFHGQKYDKERYMEEIGGLLWYISALCTSLGISLSEAMEYNIQQLMERHPDGFSTAYHEAKAIPENPHIEIYTDGSEKKRSAGWGYVAVIDGKIISKNSGSAKNSTSLKAELIAIAGALSDEKVRSLYEEKGATIEIVADSKYAIEAISGDWVGNAHTRSTIDVILDQMLPFYNGSVTFTKVKGHNNFFNDMAHGLANGGRSGV